MIIFINFHQALFFWDFQTLDENTVINLINNRLNYTIEKNCLNYEYSLARTNVSKIKELKSVKNFNINNNYIISITRIYNNFYNLNNFYIFIL